MEDFISYAQFEEDLIIYNLLKDEVKDNEKYYVDIGANDPICDSVTKNFYLNGWKGINVEPIPTLHEKLKKDRPQDENLCCGVSNKNGNLNFYECIKVPGNSTFNKNVFEKLSSQGLNFKEQIVPIKTLTDIYKESSFFNKEIPFCKIDVEGLEKEVIDGIDFDEFHPWLFVIESTFPNTNNPTFSTWEKILLNGSENIKYVFALQEGINRYYIRSDKINLKRNILPLDELNNKYNVFKVLNIKSYPYKIGKLFVKIGYPFYKFYTKIRKN